MGKSVEVRQRKNALQAVTEDSQQGAIIVRTREEKGGKKYFEKSKKIIEKSA